MKKIKEMIKRLLGKHQETISEMRKRGVVIGENVHILNSNIDHGHGFLITIGNNVTITGATVLAHDASIYKVLGKSKVGRVEIGNDVFIGINTTILMNTKIGNRIVIGAGSVVSGVIPDNSVVVGNPAKIIGTFDDYINKHKEKMKSALIFDTPSPNKTDAQKREMVDKIKMGVIAYDD